MTALAEAYAKKKNMEGMHRLIQKVDMDGVNKLALRVAPERVTAELCRRSLFKFLQEFWDVLTPDEPHYNWHIPYLCQELEKVIRRVTSKEPKAYDLVINIPPGTTKSTLCSVTLPVWAWINWQWLRFITLSYSSTLSLELAEKSRDLMQSQKFKDIFPNIRIKKSKEKKSNFQIQYLQDEIWHNGGGRYSTSVGSTITGFHGDVVLIDDPINPEQASSPAQLRRTNFWMTNTLPTRTTDKNRTPFITIMQRLHEDDPSGNLIERGGIKHICLPGETYSMSGQHSARDLVRPPGLIDYYKDDLLDSKRLTKKTLDNLRESLGEYGYAAQILQNPIPLGGLLFKVENFVEVDEMPAVRILEICRYWDKAATTAKEDKKAKFTVGVKMAKLKDGSFFIMDVVRGRWSTDERERIIKKVAMSDGQEVIILHEQEPGSGGKDSAKATTKNLAGFKVKQDLVKNRGSKVTRADPYSVQVNSNNVLLLKREWVKEFKHEHMLFPMGRYADQVDASSGAFAFLARNREVEVLY